MAPVQAASRMAAPVFPGMRGSKKAMWSTAPFFHFAAQVEDGRGIFRGDIRGTSSICKRGSQMSEGTFMIEHMFD